MNDKYIDSSLTEKQQIRLATWLEGQAGVIDSFLARRCYEKIPAAKEYVHKLKETKFLVREALVDSRTENSAGIDLWGRIERRINEEERAQVFLGDRTIKGDHRWHFREAMSQLKWGLGGALVAACATIVVGNFWSGGAVNGAAYHAAGNLVQHETGQFRPVSSRDTASRETGQNEEPLFYSMSPHGENINGPAVFEVDWMKSRSGHVRVLRGPGGAPVIWVKKAQPSGQEIQLVESHVPQAIAVADR